MTEEKQSFYNEKSYEHRKKKSQLPLSMLSETAVKIINI